MSRMFLTIIFPTREAMMTQTLTIEKKLSKYGLIRLYQLEIQQAKKIIKSPELMKLYHYTSQKQLEEEIENLQTLIKEIKQDKNLSSVTITTTIQKRLNSSSNLKSETKHEAIYQVMLSHCLEEYTFSMLTNLHHNPDNRSGVPLTTAIGLICFYIANYIYNPNLNHSDFIDDAPFSNTKHLEEKTINEFNKIAFKHITAIHPNMVSIFSGIYKELEHAITFYNQFSNILSQRLKDDFYSQTHSKKSKILEKIELYQFFNHALFNFDINEHSTEEQKIYSQSQSHLKNAINMAINAKIFIPKTQDSSELNNYYCIDHSLLNTSQLFKQLSKEAQRNGLAKARKTSSDLSQKRKKIFIHLFKRFVKQQPNRKTWTSYAKAIDEFIELYQEIFEQHENELLTKLGNSKKLNPDSYQTIFTNWIKETKTLDKFIIKKRRLNSNPPINNRS